MGHQRQSAERSAFRLFERRSGHALGTAKSFDDLHARQRSNAPFTIGESRASDIYSRQAQFSDTLTWAYGKNNLRFGTSLIYHTSGGTGSEPGTATLGTFTFKAADREAHYLSTN